MCNTYLSVNYIKLQTLYHDMVTLKCCLEPPRGESTHAWELFNMCFDTLKDILDLKETK